MENPFDTTENAGEPRLYDHKFGDRAHVPRLYAMIKLGNLGTREFEISMKTSLAHHLKYLGGNSSKETKKL